MELDRRARDLVPISLEHRSKPAKDHECDRKFRGDHVLQDEVRRAPLIELGQDSGSPPEAVDQRVSVELSASERDVWKRREVRWLETQLWTGSWMSAGPNDNCDRR